MSDELKIKLKEARTKLGMSQSQFAKHLHMPVRTLQAWERDANTPRGFALTALMAKLEEILSK